METSPKEVFYHVRQRSISPQIMVFSFSYQTLNIRS